MTVRTVDEARTLAGTRTVAGTRFKIRDFGTCLFINGSGLVSIPITPIPIGSATRTLSIWYKPLAFSFTRYVISYGANSSLQEFSIMDDNGTLKFDRNGGSIDTGQAITKNKWNLLGAKYNGTNLVIGINGVWVTSTAIALNTSNSNPLSLGRRAFFGSGTITGFIDEFMCWNDYALSDDEWLDYYRAGIVPSPGSLVSQILLNEGSGTTATDSSPESNNGTISTGTYNSNEAPFNMGNDRQTI